MTVASRAVDVAVERLAVGTYTIPTDEHESDGTLDWDSTTIVVAEAEAGGETGLGYTYADADAARLIEATLADVVLRADAMSPPPPAAWRAMDVALRNAGRRRIGATAVSALDIALWHLKARLLSLPLRRCSGRRTRPFLSTGAAASPPTRSSGCGPSSRAGSRRGSLGSR